MKADLNQGVYLIVDDNKGWLLMIDLPPIKQGWQSQKPRQLSASMKQFKILA
ncbi:hypothetical protein Q4506_11460 [Colwellia sp. 4_MG-2023]|uniref:hypothetical protein n=1 Tax=unclassified Colwellia TaxID=196834 RepID=UPI001C0A6553|nr:MULTISPECIES: hypothetical protein [unclassified Colwellia]MBU2925997.1 hypothetical protein [Colwellia sp. C2M11]MDO6487025.1 hypothetical protein [Colwellia sp. 6_MG-2023]MDO6507704.1 hypothetical protein [Colwellia sp. 5_MG-2023]MDO6556306.1 hypothetical protein [Colwellia sp. 4_MG-2023]MDO6653137.1 hypothetical protein [Colwellia sp. 3_MG-2023]